MHLWKSLQNTVHADDTKLGMMDALPFKTGQSIRPDPAVWMIDNLVHLLHNSEACMLCLPGVDQPF